MMKKKSNLFTLEFLEEGEYVGHINSYNLATTADGMTNFINISIVINTSDSEDIHITKSYITNLGKNQKLRQFLKDASLLKKGNKVNFDDMIGLEVSFTIEYDDNGKLQVGDLEEHVDFSDGEEEFEEDED